MTTTTTTTQDTGHESPCFCDRCGPTAVMDLIDERAKLLDVALADRTYTDGYERELAEELIAGIPVADRVRVLEFMVTWEHLQPRVMTVDCLLDECDDRTYKALEAMAAILLAAIRAQGTEGISLYVLVRNEILGGQKLMEARRRYGWED
jgi:hypothetical protein